MKTILALIILLGGVGYVTYTMYMDKQYKYGLLCRDVSTGIFSLKDDAASSDSQNHLRYEAVKLIAVTFAEIRTALPKAELTPELMGQELNELNYLCLADPTYQIGKITQFAAERYYGERSNFNPEFSQKLGKVKIYQNTRITEIGQWLADEMKK